MNFNWMPLSKAINELGLDCVVWWINNGTVSMSTSAVSTLLRCVCDDRRFADGLSTLVCRALVPEVPSWEEQSK